jgi:purine-binding chemotaxis protein CheW
VSDGDDVLLVLFRVGGRWFAVDVFQVERILAYEVPTPLPGAPEFLDGVVPYGDGTVPVLDLRTRLEVEAPIREDTRVMVVNVDGARVGVVVDAVVEVLRVSAVDVRPPPDVVRGLAAQYITGILSRPDRTVVVLAVGKLLSSAERVALDELLVEASHE